MAITRVNSTAAFTAGSSTTVSSAAQSLTAGNRNVVGVRFTTTNTSISSVTDTAGNTYELVKEVVDSNLTSGTTLAFYQCTDCVGHANNVVTVTFGAAVTNRSLAVVQYAGSASYETLAVIWDEGAAGTLTVKATFTLSDALIVMAWQVDNTAGTTTAGSGLSKSVADASQVLSMLEGIITSPTTLTPGASSTAAANKKATAGLVLRPPASSGEASFPFVG